MDVSDGSSNYNEDDRTVSSDEAIPMKRIVQSGGVVTHSIDGWPAAISFDVGYGQVFITTVSGYGWTRLRKDQDPDPLKQSKYSLYDWGKQLSNSLTGLNRNKTPLQDEVDYPLQRLGVPIIPKFWVVISLGLFVGILVTLGAWRLVAQDLAPLGILVPGIAVLLTAAMVFGRSFVQSEVQETLSRFQLVEFAVSSPFGAWFFPRTSKREIREGIHGSVTTF